MTARRGSLDDEAVGADLGVAVKVGRELVERDDREEVGPGQCRQVGAEQGDGVGLDEWAQRATGDVDGDPADLGRDDSARSSWGISRGMPAPMST